MTKFVPKANTVLLKIFIFVFLIITLLFNLFYCIPSFQRIYFLLDKDPLNYVRSSDKISDGLKGNGGVFLKFVNFPYVERGLPNRISFIYYRMSERLYPEKVSVSLAERVILDGNDIIEENSPPSVEWLEENGIQNVLVFIKNGDGSIRLIKKQVPKIGQK